MKNYVLVFNGKPEYVENLMIFIARELREIMARLGIRSVAELVGRIDLVRQNLKTITSNCLVSI